MHNGFLAQMGFDVFENELSRHCWIHTVGCAGRVSIIKDSSRKSGILKRLSSLLFAYRMIL